MVKAEANEPQALVDALKQGRHYSSQGPLIENVTVDGDFIEIACSPAFQILLVGRASKNEKISGLGTTSARLPCRKFEGDWCRLVVIDEAGKIAWSNPIYL
ncbi:hypothetical protein [Bosea sp. AK1]|uniref:hypothetical protein n=1 Tax=Bosea sp. AK1 TaxID=2587160 RepID=UPI00114E8464|nr:hypothetical protein [Bosea sp. AK1]